MGARQYYEAASSGESTTASSTYQDKVTLGFTPDASSTYWLMWSAQLTRTIAAGSGAKVRLFDGTTTYGEQRFNPTNNAEYACVGGLGRLDSGGSPSAVAIDIEYSDGNGAATGKIKNAVAIALKADAADQYAESTGVSTTGSDSWQDKTTLTFTPATEGDYLIIAMGELSVSNMAITAQARLDVDGSAQYATQTGGGIASVDFYMPVAAMLKLTLSAASHSIKWQFRRTTAGAATANIRNARILALRMSSFDNAYYADDRTRDTYNADTAVQDQATLTQTPQALDHLFMGAALIDGNNTSNNVNGYLDEDGTDLIAMPHRSGTRNAAVFGFDVRDLSASSHTWKTQYDTSNTGTTVGFAESALAVLQLEPSAGGGQTIAIPIAAYHYNHHLGSMAS